MSESSFYVAILAAFIHAVWNIAAKRSSANYCVSWLGQLVAALAVMPWAVGDIGSHGIPRAVWGPLVLCAFTQALYFIALIRAYRWGDISMVYPLARGVGVAGSAATGWMFFRESAGGIAGMGVALIVLAAVLFALGSRRSIDPVKARRSVMAAMCVGVILIIAAANDKYVITRLDPVTYTFCMCLSGVALTAPYVLMRKRAELRIAWATGKTSAIIIGLGSAGGYLMILKVLTTNKLVYVTSVREVGIVFGTALGVKFLGERLTPMKGFGIVAIVAGIVMIRFGS